MPADGYGFKMIGGNSVGLFVSEVRPGRKEVQAGDQILQINGRGTRAMTHYQATVQTGRMMADEGNAGTLAAGGVVFGIGITAIMYEITVTLIRFHQTCFNDFPNCFILWVSVHLPT